MSAASSSIVHFDRVTRVEVIGKERLYVGNIVRSVKLQMQDDGKTMKIFLKDASEL